MTELRSIARKGALFLAALALPATASAQTCVSQREAEALFLYVAPELIREAGRVCAPSLPAASPLRQPSGALIAKYRAEADGAWPLAKSAFAKLSGAGASELGGLAQLLDSQFARPAAAPMMAQMIAAGIRADDCPLIDRAMTLIEPLPARNAAGLAAIAFDLAGREDRGRAMAVRICPAPRAAR
ncbi:hypothetical protein [Sphingomonas baiyangensis]|uniref:Uncharacterized protein n=1 Tax=Sphingomonas baiyangensis TaxID=2572576 RepID=A0A4U1L0Y7_9SPHN|nr:hypothetical protein [Sphingomonas baiyangensis]TKD50457.1 hypothetical protein FBR43_06540 [Sphingomonas baiyangensis]